jgi:hypothetical protein
MRRLAIWGALGTLLLAPGIVAGQAADVSLRGPLVVAGKPFTTSEAPRLSDYQASRVANGVCTYPFTFNVVNGGGAATTSPVTARLEVDGQIAAMERGITLAAGESSRRTMPVALRPGLHVIELILSETVARKDVGDGKFLKAFVIVRGPCRPPPESIIIMPRPEPPSEPSDEKTR